MKPQYDRMFIFMAKLYFYYSAMNAGKTTTLLQSDFNYRERGMNTLCLLPSIVVNSFNPLITSRIGLSKKPVSLGEEMNIADYVTESLKKTSLSCILVDEAQFLTKNHVLQLCEVVDTRDIPVLTYGLRTDFQGELFQGSQALLALADQLIEIKTICFCGKKAIMTARTTPEGLPITQGNQVDCGGNDRYVALCRKHHREFCKETDRLIIPVSQAG
jgi:thymidine kinase